MSVLSSSYGGYWYRLKSIFRSVGFNRGEDIMASSKQAKTINIENRSSVWPGGRTVRFSAVAFALVALTASGAALAQGAGPPMVGPMVSTPIPEGNIATI